MENAGFIVLSGNLFNDAIMKTSVIDQGFARAFSPTPTTRTPSRAARSCSMGLRTITGDRRPEAQDRRAFDPLHARHRAHWLSGRSGSGQHAAAGRAHQEGRPRAALYRRWTASERRLALDPQRLAGGGCWRGLALLKTGDRVRVDLKKRSANILISDADFAERRRPHQASPATTIPEPDAVAAGPARDDRAVRRRHGAEARRRLPSPRPDRWRAAAPTITRRRGLRIYE